MSPFTPAEIEYLRSQPLARVATASAKGTPDVAPVTFTLADDGTIEIGGMDNTRTIKYRNVLATGKAAVVIDDLATTDPWRPRGVKVRGRAEGVEVPGGGPVIRITPETIWSWSLNDGADTRFGPIERREVG
jgi:pyridoxamine 5'-phosphate oxidase family protein